MNLYPTLHNPCPCKPNAGPFYKLKPSLSRNLKLGSSCKPSPEIGPSSSLCEGIPFFSLTQCTLLTSPIHAHTATHVHKVLQDLRFGSRERVSWHLESWFHPLMMINRWAKGAIKAVKKVSRRDFGFFSFCFFLEKFWGKVFFFDLSEEQFRERVNIWVLKICEKFWRELEEGHLQVGLGFRLVLSFCLVCVLKNIIWNLHNIDVWLWSWVKAARVLESLALF